MCIYIHRLPCLALNNIVRFVPAIYLSSSVGRALGLESRVGSSPT